MDILGRIEKLAERAVEEETPVFHIGDKAVRQIRLGDSGPSSLIVLDWFAGLSVVAASIVLGFAIHSWVYLANPIMELWTPVEEIPLW